MFMARGINRLSARTIAGAKKPGVYSDGAGLCLQVTANISGSITKSWIYRFMLAGRPRKMGLGACHTFTLLEARELARQARQTLARGIDPIEHRRAEFEARRRDEAANITFRDAADRYLAAHESSWRSAKHRRQWRTALATHAYPALAGRPVQAIDAAIINSTLAEAWRKTPSTAGRVRRRIAAICQWIKDGQPLPQSSTTKTVKHFRALPWQELPFFMSELRQIDGIAARALEFCILTSARTGEVRGATWGEIDFDSKLWTISSERMKSHRPHRVPLSDRAIEILTALPRMKGENHVFAGTRTGAAMGDLVMLRLLRVMRAGQTVHGFRSAFRDWCSESTSYPGAVAEMALAHAIPNKTEAAYRRGELLEKRKRLMRDWSVFCSRSPIAETANITPLRGRG
jgi:integrase